eukprot:TRINITY_DN83_c0_g3_i1.p1 TRINITY_DN83_c0_g3~~TRINITY_DN83_c0_g3_i1.p1  ORF type:complete len:482 (+),score=100.41 TRINITY_DN83_c0_g3_i1:95-1540(+)
MVCFTMLPETAFQRAVSATDVAATAATPTPMSDCQSPLDRWLGLPAAKMQPKLPSLMPTPEQEAVAAFPQAVMGQVPPMNQQQFPMVGMQMQPPQFTQMQLPQQMFQQVGGAVQQATDQQPTWVYFMPVGAPPPVPPAPVANNWPYQQNMFVSAQQGCAVDSGSAQSGGSADSLAEVANASDSEDEGAPAPAGSTQRLTASQARRRRRQRAAAFARAEQLQQQQQQFVAPFATPRKEVVDPASAPTLSAEMCKHLTEEINAGGDSTRAALASLARSARRFCFDNQGCRVLQLAIERGSLADVAVLLKELHGCVLRAAASPHGNFVLQKVVEVMPAAASRFIAEELCGQAAETACGKFGCRILCRLLEHSAGEERTVQLIEEVLLKAGELVRHEFGHHVIESILEHGMDRHKQLLMAALEREMPLNVLNRNALFVLDRAMNQSTPRERSCLSAALRRPPQTSMALHDPALSAQLRSILARAA